MTKFVRLPVMMALLLIGATSAILLGPTNPAFAQVACPAGTVPISGGSVEQSYAGCIPLGSEDSDDATGRWETRWGAIALANGAFGYSTSYASESIARNEAMKSCQARAGNQRCTVAMAYHDQCVALAWGDDGYAINRGPDLRQVEQDAMADCAKNRRNCRLFYSDCSMPQRVE